MFREDFADFAVFDAYAAGFKANSNNMSHDEEVEAKARLAQKVLAARRAVERGRLHILPEQRPLAEELVAAPLGATGLVEIEALSDAALMFARVVGMAVNFENQEKAAPSIEEIGVADSQTELFRLFARLFIALTGEQPLATNTEQRIKALMMERVLHEAANFERTVGGAMEELAAFYDRYRVSLFQQAKKLGGVKLVTGGQRSFGPSALQGIRISGLYADTQLIPDPVYPYLVEDLHQNARHLQLALTLSELLKLTPLVEARLPVAPVFVFPSFEEELERNDAWTKVGIEDLAVQLVGGICPGKFASLGELYEFAAKHEGAFIHAVAKERMFIPPGADPAEILHPADAAKRYLAELEGVRDAKLLDMMKRLPLGVLVLNGICERLRPQFHLRENSVELNAQPLLTQAVHWYYFDKCASSTAQSLVRKAVISEQSFSCLRALHDDSLAWLANIPVEGLTELHRNLEHQAFREDLKKCTAQLASAGPMELDEAIREVRTGLEYLVMRHQKALRDIEDKYAPKRWGVYAGGAAGLVTAASAVFLPSLAPLISAALPGAVAAGALVGVAKELAGQGIESRRASKSLVGMLAVARQTRPL